MLGLPRLTDDVRRVAQMWWQGRLGGSGPAMSCVRPTRPDVRPLPASLTHGGAE